MSIARRLQRTDRLAGLADAVLDGLESFGSVGLGVFDSELRFVHINRAMAALNGRPVRDHIGRTILEILPSTGDQLAEIMRGVLKGEALLDVVITAPAPDGRTFRASYLPLLGAGEPLVAAVVVETTAQGADAVALHINEQRLRLALEGTNTGIWEWNVRTNGLRWSDGLGPMFGLDRGERPADTEAFLELVHPDDRAEVRKRSVQAVKEGRGSSYEFRALRPDGELRWIEARTHLISGDGGAPLALLGINSDVTERRRRQQAAEFLADASLVLSRPLEARETLRELARLAVPVLGDWTTVHLAREDGSIDALGVWHTDSARVAEAWELTQRWPVDAAGVSGVGEVISTGRPQLMPDVGERELIATARDAEHLAALRRLGLCSAMIVPLVARGQTLGAMSFGYSESGRRHTPGDLRLAQDLGRRAGLALDNARLYEGQLDVALTLQRSLLPRSLPEPAGLELGAAYLAAGHHTEAGGDWYEVVVLPDGGVGLVVGDVVGHGIDAAAVMGQLRSASRAYALECLGPAELLGRLSRFAQTVEGALYATAVYVVIDRDRARARYAGAGHPPGLLLAPGQAPRFLAERLGPVLGGVPDERFEDGEFALEPGASLLLFSDGAVERRGEIIDSGLARLAAVAAEEARGPQQLCDALPGRLFGDDAPRDDVVFLAARRPA